MIGAGITLFEALKAYDLLKADGIAIRVVDAYSVQPIDADDDAAMRARDGAPHHRRGSLRRGRPGRCRGPRGGADGGVVTRLAVREIPRSGTPDELVDFYGLSARKIADAVRARSDPAVAGASPADVARDGLAHGIISGSGAP